MSFGDGQFIILLRKRRKKTDNYRFRYTLVDCVVKAWPITYYMLFLFGKDVDYEDLLNIIRSYSYFKYSVN